jgi:hypothetical protein
MLRAIRWALRWFVLPVIAAVVAATVTYFSVKDNGTSTAGKDVTAVNTTRDISYVPLDTSAFVQQHTVDGWINRPGGPDFGAMDAHAWDLWHAINEPTDQKLHGTPLPVWETWYSAEEVFLDKQGTEVKDPDDRDLDPPNQSIDAGALAVQTGTAPRLSTTVLSFNRYNRQMLDHVHQNLYYDRRVLNDMSSAFVTAKTPAAQRSIAEFPTTSVMLKPVWWIVPGDRPSTMPYWAGGTPDVATDQRNPSWQTWKQCVLVDPTGKADNKSDQVCNQNLPGQTPMKAGTYGVRKINIDPAKSDFYGFKLNQDEVGALGQFKQILSNTNKEGKAEEVQAGDYAILVAMHVSTRETANWTWQTYWWVPDAHKPAPLPPNSQAPPPGIPAPFDQFDMCNADVVTVPVDQQPNGTPWLCYNPYLETDLHGLLTPDRTDDTEVGIHSNCQSCHRAAKVTPGVKSADYAVHGYVDKNDPAWFGKSVGTEFLWSMALRAHDPPFSAPTPTPTKSP